MIELADTLPDINVQPAEYKRLLGYPPHALIEDRARELVDWARAWYAAHGRPWVYARLADSAAISGDGVVINDVAFQSKRLHKMFSDAAADGAILVAVGAGPELEAEAQRLWREGKPDEYFFLEIYGSAVVEHLVTGVGARLCSWADGHRQAVLPHYSPGYPEWDISQQRSLLELLRRTSRQSWPSPIEVLDSGMLKPKKSLLALFGLTRHVDRVRRLTDLVPCENCSFGSCQYRRVSYRRATVLTPSELAPPAVRLSIPESEPVDVHVSALQRDAKYVVNARALRRWASERLKLEYHADGTIDAFFRYEGTTCSNTGRTILFDYKVRLGPREEGYPLRQLHCGPAPGDEGHRFMCRYMSNAEHLMVAIDHERPLLGQPLNDVLSWDRPAAGAGCYCEPKSRKHKWGLVLETIHYALVQGEEQSRDAPATVTA